jgi:hypothetical protein
MLAKHPHNDEWYPGDSFAASAGCCMHRKLMNWIIVATVGTFLACPLLAKPLQAATNHNYVLADYGLKNPSFNMFRAQLLAAVLRHDRKFVDDVLSPNVELGLGAGVGKREFNKQWQNLSPTSIFWARMQRVLIHGAEFAKDTGRIQAPATSFDDARLGDTIQAIVWNKESILRDGPKDSAVVIDRLHNEQVTVLQPDSPSPIHDSWVKVQTQNGKIGFMKSDDVYSAYDEFAEFKKTNGKWQLIWFGVAGL